MKLGLALAERATRGGQDLVGQVGIVDSPGEDEGADHGR